MGWDSGTGDETGGTPGPDPDVPGAGADGMSGADDGLARDARLAGFAPGGEWNACAPGPELAAILAGVSGPDQRCPGAEPGELTGVLRRWAAVESWAAAGSWRRSGT